MSEPMSTIDIEDVLSSIRKLVSEDLRPATPKEPMADPAAPTVSAAGPKGKLLLTSALRVVSDQADEQQNRVDAPEAPYAFVEDDDLGTPAQVLQASPAAVETALADEPSIVESAQTNEEDWLPENNDEAEPFPGWAPMDTPTSEQAASDVTRVVSEIAAGVSEVDEDWESETGDAPEVSWRNSDWGPEVEAVEPEPLNPRVVKAIADKAEAAAVAEVLAASTEAAPNVATVAENESEPELRFDEAVLRDLVRDLIHEELSGTLGERITRNVRKLVRAEINRAMTAKNLD